MKTAKILAWLAALALISNVDGHSRLIEILTDTIADLSAMLTECHEAKEKGKCFR